MEDQKIEILKLQKEKMDIEKSLNTMADSMEEDRKKIQKEITEKNKAELEFIAESCLKSKCELSSLKSIQKQFLEQIGDYTEKIKVMEVNESNRKSHINAMKEYLKSRKYEVLQRDLMIGKKDSDLRKYIEQVDSMLQSI